MNRDYIKGLKERDKDIVQAIYNDCFPQIKLFILNNSGSQPDAQDVFHDGLIILYGKISKPDFKLTVKLNTYLFSICKNIWLKRLRSRKLFNKIQQLPEFQTIDRDMSIDFELESQLAFIRRKVFSLDGKCRKLLLLFLEGHSLKEIAIILNYSYNYTKKKKYNCKESLKKIIKEDRHFKDYFD